MTNFRVRLVFLFLVLVFGLSGCTEIPPPTAPSPTAPLTVTGTPDDGRRQTAFEAYPPAEARARLWRTEAVLHQIAVTRIMETNLGLPPGSPGWFFMFRVPGETLEFYVKVSEGTVIGTTEAQPIMAEKLPYKYLPIDLQRLTLDSKDVVRLYMEHGGAEYVAAHPRLELDYRLVHLEGQPNPVWSLFDVTDFTQDIAPLFNVDAVTGEIVDDPFASFAQ